MKYICSLTYIFDDKYDWELLPSYLNFKCSIVNVVNNGESRSREWKFEYVSSVMQSQSNRAGLGMAVYHCYRWDKFNPCESQLAESVTFSIWLPETGSALTKKYFVQRIKRNFRSFSSSLHRVFPFFYLKTLSCIMLMWIIKHGSNRRHFIATNISPSFFFEPLPTNH